MRRETPQVETKSEELTVLFVGASLKVLPKVMGMHTLKVLSTNNNNAQLKVTIHNIVQNAILGIFHSTLDCYLARKNVLIARRAPAYRVNQPAFMTYDDELCAYHLE